MQYMLLQKALMETLLREETGWAVQMAIDSDKDVFVFDQSRNRWFTYDIELFRMET